MRLATEAVALIWVIGCAAPTNHREAFEPAALSPQSHDQGQLNTKTTANADAGTPACSVTPRGRLYAELLLLESDLRLRFRRSRQTPTPSKIREAMKDYVVACPGGCLKVGNEAVVDPWGNEILVQTVGQESYFYSYGPNREDDGGRDDDVEVPIAFAIDRPK